MEALLHQVFTGLASGAVYASLALALVMIYRVTRFVNFAQGELALCSTYVAWAMTEAGVSYWLAFVTTLVMSFAMGVFVERVVVRPAMHAPALSVVMVFIGLMVILNSVAGWVFGYTTRAFPSPFPAEPLFGNHYLGSHELGMIGVTLVMLGALYAFFRFTSLGLALRAVADNAESSRLVGIRVERMLALGWGLASVVGAVAGMMIAPIVFLDPSMMAGTMLYAFAAALLGGIDSPGGAVAGGFAVGILENLVGAYVVGTELKLTTALALIVGVLIFRPTGLFGQPSAARGLDVSPRPPQKKADARDGKVSVAVAVAALVACAIPLWGSSYHLFQLTLVVIYAIALLGLNLLTGYGGQISLGHGAFYGIGAYTTAILVHNLSVPYWLTLPCAGVVCLVLGFVFGLPAVRLEGLHLALATFALGVVFPQILKCRGIERLTGGVQGITLEKTPAPFGLPLSDDQWLYCFSLATAIVLFIAARNLMRGHTGRVIVAIRDREVAASSVGVDTALYKSLTFGLSAMYTGIAGALSVLAVQFVGPDSFSVFLSISLLVGVVVGGLASISGAVYGALFIQFVPNIADDISKAAPSAVYGVALVLSVYLMPRGVAGFVRSLAGALEARRNARRTTSRHVATVAPGTPVTQSKEGP